MRGIRLAIAIAVHNTLVSFYGKNTTGIYLSSYLVTRTKMPPQMGGNFPCQSLEFIIQK